MVQKALFLTISTKIVGLISTRGRDDRNKLFSFLRCEENMQCLENKPESRELSVLTLDYIILPSHSGVMLYGEKHEAVFLFNFYKL